ncbi:MAG: DUF4910 domain-containing protein [Deinococcales bacterium]|jgi:aminopeptidase-like protein
MTETAVAARERREARMQSMLEELYPWLRSITGVGLRRTLARLAAELPGLEMRSVPTGTMVYDWRIPREWRLHEAYVNGPDGERIIDVRWHNLHVVNYSVPVHRSMSLQELRPHLHSLPDRPGWIPYRTSYYTPSWGFCLAHEQLELLREGTYEVVIESEMVDGSLDYGELFVPGETDDEVLFSAHVCHPSLANDNLSGVIALVELARTVAARARRRFGYRFLFAPGTIGAVAFLSRNRDTVRRIRHGLVVTGVGGPGVLHYKRTRDGAVVDRIMERVLGEQGDHRMLPFSPDGYDERQFNSPGLRLPVGRLSRLPHGQYPEYHTSADDLSFVRSEAIEGAVRALEAFVKRVEGDGNVLNVVPCGEPQFSRRGLTGSALDGARPGAVAWVLNLADGEHTFEDMADRSGLGLGDIRAAVDVLEANGLLDRYEGDPAGATDGERT